MHNNNNNNNNNNNSINNNKNNSCLQPGDHLLRSPDENVHAVDRDESNEDHPKNPTNQASIAVEENS